MFDYICTITYQPSLPSAEELALKRRIDEIYTAYPFYGSRRICQQIRREGQVISRKSIQRQMQQMGNAADGPDRHRPQAPHEPPAP